MKYNYALKYEDVMQEIAKDMTEDLRKMLPAYYIEGLDHEMIEFDNYMATWIHATDRETGDEYNIHISIENDTYRFYQIFAYPFEEDGDHKYVESQRKFIEYIKSNGIGILV